MITKEYLENEIKNLKVQEANLLANANAANGAWRAFEALLNKLEEEKLEVIE